MLCQVVEGERVEKVNKPSLRECAVPGQEISRIFKGQLNNDLFKFNITF
jgi:hypothetical protein